MCVCVCLWSCKLRDRVGNFLPFRTSTQLNYDKNYPDYLLEATWAPSDLCPSSVGSWRAGTARDRRRGRGKKLKRRLVTSVKIHTCLRRARLTLPTRTGSWWFVRSNRSIAVELHAERNIDPDSESIELSTITPSLFGLVFHRHPFPRYCSFDNQRPKGGNAHCLRSRRSLADSRRNGDNDNHMP